MNIINTGAVGGPALLSVVNPASLATIAVIALGTAGVQWLLSVREETVSVEDALVDLDLPQGSSLAVM